MVFTPAACQRDLMLALAKAGFICIGCLINALVAADASLIAFARCVLRQYWPATPVAQHVRAFLQPVADAHTIVKDETFTLPVAVFLRYFFEVFQNAALKVKHVLYPLPDKVIR